MSGLESVEYHVQPTRMLRFAWLVSKPHPQDVQLDNVEKQPIGTGTNTNALLVSSPGSLSLHASVLRVQHLDIPSHTLANWFQGSAVLLLTTILVIQQLCATPVLSGVDIGVRLLGREVAPSKLERITHLP